MTNDRIREIRDSKQKAADRKLKNYHDSGYSKYYTEYCHYDDLVNICNIALSISDIREENIKMKAIFNELFGVAKRLTNHPDEEDMKLFVNRFYDACCKNGFRRD